jgi:uncharacterized membrane protein YbhN (UPF0104 family)
LNEGSVAAPAEGLSSRRRAGIAKPAAIALKLIVTGLCFWYISRRIDLSELARRAGAIDAVWAGAAVVAIAAQIPLIGLRWCAIIDALSNDREPIARRHVIAISAIGIFFGQVLPYAVGDTVRVLMLAQRGRDWRQALVSVLIDRGMGVVVLVAFGFVILLFPSALTALGGHRGVTLEVFGGLLAGFALGLVLAPRVAPLLERWPVLRWLGRLALATHDVLWRRAAGARIVLLAAAIHALTILSVWSTGMALGLSFSVVDAAVLFALMVAVSLIPFSFGGWGVREVAVMALLTANGLSAEQALFFSVCFGLVLVAGALPGAVVWATYSPARSPTS